MLDLQEGLPSAVMCFLLGGDMINQIAYDLKLLDIIVGNFNADETI